MKTSFNAKSLSILFVLLAACGNAESSPRAARVPAEPRTSSEAVAQPVSAPVPATPAIQLPTLSVEAQAPAPSPAQMSVVAATFTHGVEGRRPIDRVTTFAVGDRATVHLVVKNLGAPRDVTVQWMRGDVEIGRMVLEVGTSPSWRTWATRRVTARDVASGIRARIVDDQGNELEVIEAPVATAPGA